MFINLNMFVYGSVNLKGDKLSSYSLLNEEFLNINEFKKKYLLI